MLKNIAIVAIAAVLGACQSGPVLDIDQVDVPEGAPELYSSLADLGAGPYTVGANPDVSPDTVALLQAAIEHANSMAGFEVFRWQPVLLLAQARATTAIPEKLSTLAYAARMADTGQCDLAMGRPSSMEIQDARPGVVDVNTAAHELVHCLGIGHDANPDSLMHARKLRGLAQAMTPETVELLHRMAGHH